MKRGRYLKFPPGSLLKELLGPMRPSQVFPKPPIPSLLQDLAAVSLKYPHLKPGTRGWHGSFASHLQRLPQYKNRSRRTLSREVNNAFAWLRRGVLTDPQLREHFHNTPAKLDAAIIAWLQRQVARS